MVLQSTYPTDIRVRKEIETLTDAGHDVTLLCRGVSELFTEMESPKREKVHGAQIVRINDRRGTNLILDQAYFNFSFRYPTWERALANLVEERDIDVIHAHDLPIVKSCSIVGGKYNLPVVADLHENYPAAMTQWRSSWDLKQKLLTTAFLKPIHRYRRLEKEWLPQTSHIITVTEEMYDHYSAIESIDPNDVSIVRNMVDKSSFKNTNLENVLDNGSFNVVYVGTFGPHRRLETAIRGFSLIVDDHPEAQLVLVGAAANEHYGKKLRNIVREEGLADKVVFTGWVDIQLVPSYMNDADVGIILHSETEHTNMALPHKLSQYLYMGCPVVVTDRPPLRRIVDKYDCGIVVNDTPESFASAIAELSEESTQHKRLSENALRAAKTRCNWDSESESLISMYEAI
jgi:glycosyltransferase involved in cell wall biosynthesis